MENREKENSILIPVFDICNIPPLEKIASIANKNRLRVHIAGFIPSGKEPGKLMEQTIRLTRILKVVLHRLKRRVKSVSSKIYINTRVSKIKHLIEDQHVRLIVSKKIDDKFLHIEELKNIMFLQLSKTNSKNDYSEAKPLVIHNGNNRKLHDAEDVLSQFCPLMEIKKHSEIKGKVPLSKDLMEMVRQQGIQYLAIDRRFLNEKNTRNILHQEKSAVLIY